jgi:hypothetical protein
MTSTTRPAASLRFARRLAPAAAAVWLCACGSSNSNPTTVGTAMTDANNYTASSHMTIPVIPTKAATDLTLDWSGITKDLLCHTATPIKSVTFAVFPNKTKMALENELSVGLFNTAEVSKYFIQDVDSGTTSTMLSSLKANKTMVDPASDYTESSTSLYLVLFANSTTPGVGAESMVLLQPSASSDATTVMAPDACSGNILSFSATLGSPLSVPNKAPYTLDWSKLTHDGFNNPILFTSINKVEIGYYQGMQASDLMAHFLDAEIDATTLYAATLPGGQKSFDLTGAKTDGGEAFSGFSPTDGAWAAALLCGNCSVPAPIAFTVLQPQ